RPRPPRGPRSRRGTHAHPARVRAALLPGEEPRPGVLARRAPDQGLGLRLPRRDPHGRRARAPPARQARRGGRPPDRHRDRRGLQVRRQMIGLLHSVTGRLVVGFALVLSGVLALLASYVGRAERASVLAALDEDLRGVTALLAQNIPPAAIEKKDAD